MSAKHTTGPLTAHGCNVMSGDRLVATCTPSYGDGEDNATFLAAAPDLLAALKHTADLIEAMGATAHAARAAIAKAEGRT